MRYGLQSIWLVGGNENDRHILSEGFPSVMDHAPVLMPHVPLEAIYLADFGLISGAPSTGFVGKVAMACHRSRSNYNARAYTV